MLDQVDPDRIANLRDAADFPGAGSLLRPGQLLRSGHLHQAADSDLDALFAAGVRTVVDFRDDIEQQRAPSPRWAGVVTRNHPIRDPEFNIDRLTEHVMNRNTASIDLTGQILDAYRRFPYTHTESLSAPARALAAGDGAVLVHCTAGKDRTGLAVALLQLALGIPYEPVMDHYLASGTYLADTNSVRIRAIAAMLDDPDWITPALEVRPEYLNSALQAVERTDGSIERYVQRWELSDQDWMALRSRML